MNKILIIDDDSFICSILKKHLENHDFEVITALTGRTAIDVFRKNKFDLVICDFRLPETSGLELMQKIHSMEPEMPVIIMTAYADVRMAVKLMKLGAADYITKPVQQEELLSLIRKLINGRPAGTRLRQRVIFNNGDFIIGKSEKIQYAMNLARKVAPTNMSVLIGGETGIGKEYMARFIHQKSLRKDKPFVAIDCGAIPRELANSILFGHKKGSFTGAISDKTGLFQQAHLGTLFLDEVGNLSYDVQLKLLRAIQERVITKLGDDKLIESDIRIIAANNEDLLKEVKENSFREDLYHRLNEFKIHLPPLRERPEDIPVFVNQFIEMANNELNRQIKGLDSEAEKVIMEYPWYGNLRELKNVIKRAVLMADQEVVDRNCFPEEIIFPENNGLRNGNNQTAAVADSRLKNASAGIEKEIIVKTLKEANFNKSKAARLLNIDRKTLYNKMKLFDIDP